MREPVVTERRPDLSRASIGSGQSPQPRKVTSAQLSHRGVSTLQLDSVLSVLDPDPSGSKQQMMFPFIGLGAHRDVMATFDVSDDKTRVLVTLHPSSEKIDAYLFQDDEGTPLHKNRAGEFLIKLPFLIQDDCYKLPYKQRLFLVIESK